MNGSAQPLADTVSAQSVAINGSSALGSAGLVFPVYLDPEVLNNYQDYTYTDHLYPTASYYNNTPYEHLGYVTASDGTHIARSFWQLDTSNIEGTTIQAATFNVYPQWSYSCTPEPATLYLTGPISSATTWNNMPATSTLQDTQTWAQQNPSFPGGNPSTACPTNGNPIFFNATNAAQQAATANWSNVTLGLFTNEANPYYWKQVSDQATLTVGYFHTPGTATGGTVTPCTTCSSPYVTNSAKPTVTATATDSDGVSLDYQYNLYTGWTNPPTGNPYLSYTQSNVASGAQSSWAVTTALADAGYYEYQVRACVHGYTSVCGGWSTPVEFLVDTTGQPSNVQGFAGNGQAEITWSGSPNAIGPIDSYTIIPTGPGNPQGTVVSCAHTLYCANGVVTGLINGDSYTFNVYAHNVNGYSQPGQVKVTPSATAAPYPVVTTQASAGNGSAYVTWTPAPANGGPAVTGYYVDAWLYNTSNSSCTTNYVGYELAPATATNFVYTSGGTGGTLVNGTWYCFVVYPLNSTNYTFDLDWTNSPTNSLYAAGVESATNAVKPSATPAPYIPVNAQAAAGNNLILVQWNPNPNSSGGPAPTSYLVQVFTYNNETLTQVDSQSVPAPATNWVFTGSDATNGSQYLFAVYATNGNGNSYWTLTSPVTPQSTLSGAIAPTNPNATPADSSAVVTWTAPVLSVPSTTTYSVNVYNAASNALVGTSPAGIDSNSCSTGSANDPPAVGPKPAPCAVVSNLTNGQSLVNGTSYYFTVTATTANIPTGTSANSNTVTPAGRPFSPSLTSVANVPPAGGEANVTWTAPPTQGNGVPGNNGSPIISYTITATPTGGGNSNATQVSVTYQVPSPDPGSYSDVVGGLLNGTTYAVTVTATNSVGASDPSNSISITPIGVPLTPVNVSAQAGPDPAKATVTWSPAPAQANGVPGDNGSAITSYTITTYRGGLLLNTQYFTASDPEPAAYSEEISDLPPGPSYTFTVAATNAVGDSPPSPQTAGISTFGPPGEPQNLTVQTGDGNAVLSWTPATANGSSILNYRIVSIPAAIDQTVDASQQSGPNAYQVTVSPLTNGTSYQFKVTATNGYGTGPAAVVNDAPPMASAPNYSNSYYVSAWTNLASDPTGGQDYVRIRKRGYADGVRAGQQCSAKPTSLKVVLDFGRLAYTGQVAYNGYGTFEGATTGDYMGDDTIVFYAEQYAYGLLEGEQAAGSSCYGVQIDLGTSNSYPCHAVGAHNDSSGHAIAALPACPNAPQDNVVGDAANPSQTCQKQYPGVGVGLGNYAAGKAWADAVYQVQYWLSGNNPDGVDYAKDGISAGAGDDIETNGYSEGFSDAAPARQFVDGYIQEISSGADATLDAPIDDFGDAFTSQCLWSEADVYHVSAENGLPEALPEIYTPRSGSDADQGQLCYWTTGRCEAPSSQQPVPNQFALWLDYSNELSGFLGTMTECAPGANGEPTEYTGTTCVNNQNSTENAPNGAWSYLNAVTTDPPAGYGLQPLPQPFVSTNIYFQYTGQEAGLG